MARICIYCGKEIKDGEKCTCREASGTSLGNKSKKSKKKKTSGTSTDRRSSSMPFKYRMREFFVKLLTSKGFTKRDTFPSKIGVSFLQSLLKPVTAAGAFIRNNDLFVNVFYLALFALSFSVGIMKLAGWGLVSFLEGLLFGTIAVLLLNTTTMLVFRFAGKIRKPFLSYLSAYAMPSVYMTIFILIASAGRVSAISFFLTIAAGLAASAIAHFISLKALTGQPTERLFALTTLIYFIFLMVVSLAANLIAIPAQMNVI